MTDAGLARLAGLPLEELNLSRCYGVTDDGFRQIDDAHRPQATQSAGHTHQRRGTRPACAA